MRDFMQDDSMVAGAILLAAGAVGVLGLFIGWLLWRGRRGTGKLRHRARGPHPVRRYANSLIGP